MSTRTQKLSLTAKRLCMHASEQESAAGTGGGEDRAERDGRPAMEVRKCRARVNTGGRRMGARDWEEEEEEGSGVRRNERGRMGSDT
eukprot:4010296-Pleurochrysis_carterae.AAC.3